MSANIASVDEEPLKSDLRELVRETVQETLNALLQVKHHFLLWKQVVTTRHLGQTGKARGHHGAIMPAVDTLLELGAERRAFRTRSDKRHPFCQDEKTRLPAEMLRLDNRTTCYLEFEPPGFYSSFRPPSAMNRLRKAAFKSDRKSSHWGRFPMGRLFASTSTHARTQRFSETANLSESRGEIFNKARINAVLPPSIGPASIA